MPTEEPTQPTTPQRGEPMEIPVPSREDVENALERMAQPVPPSPERSRRRRGRRRPKEQ